MNRTHGFRKDERYNATGNSSECIQASWLGILNSESVMKQYAIVIEDAGTNLAAYVPDLPGCVATGSNPAEVERRIRVAIVMHLEGLVEDGLPIPEPSSRVEYIQIGA